MTPLPNKLIDPVPSLREALVMLLEAPQCSAMEYGGVAFSISGSKDDRDALATTLKSELPQQSPGSAQQTEAQTVRTELKDGNLVVLENYRPKPNVSGPTQKELREYALGEFAPFLELAEQGKIRALVVAVETDDDRLSITYPVGQWEPGLIAGALLLQRRLLDQG